MPTDMQRGQNIANGLIPMVVHVTSGLENPLEYWAGLLSGLSGAMAGDCGIDGMRAVLRTIVEMPDFTAEIKNTQQH